MKKPKIIIVALFVITAFFIFVKFGNDKTSETTVVQNGGNQLVSASLFSDLTKKEENFLLDVHTPEQTHIPGTDAFIPFDKIAENANQLPEDRNTPILVYCRSGSMSKQASKQIAELGYTSVYELDGGINAYKEQNNEVVITPANKELGTVIYGDIPTTTFTLTNFTPLPLKVTSVSTSCGCTTAEVEEKELEAYESTIINVSFNPAVHESDEDLGDIVRTIYIHTDSPDFERVTAEITAHVINK